MEETIEKTAENIFSSLSGYSFPDQAYMLYEIADRLKEYATECLELEYDIAE